MFLVCRLLVLPPKITVPSFPLPPLHTIFLKTGFDALSLIAWPSEFSDSPVSEGREEDREGCDRPILGTSAIECCCLRVLAVGHRCSALLPELGNGGVGAEVGGMNHTVHIVRAVVLNHIR